MRAPRIAITTALPVLSAAILAFLALSGLARSQVTGRSSRPKPAAPPPALALISEPQAGVAPFLGLIARAHRSIELTMYDLSDREVEQALAAAASRGVSVRVLLNGGYYSQPESTNAAAFSFLSTHGVHVRSSPTSFALTHQKTLTVDAIVSAIMTLNFDGLYPSTRDFAILDHRGADVRAITATFNADWSGRPVTPSTGSGDLLWSPGAQGAVLALINSAHRSIELESEEMDDAPATGALCAAAHRNVNVRVVMTDEERWHSAFEQLGACGVHVRVFHGQRYYIHAKLLEVDRRTVLIGSQNLSPTSLDANRELGIELKSPTVLTQIATAFSHDYARAAPA